MTHHKADETIWIDVKEALPSDRSVEVQAWCQDDGWYPEALYSHGAGWRVWVNGSWHTCSDVSHWAPQPPPPPKPPLFTRDMINKDMLVPFDRAGVFVPAWIEATKNMTAVEIACAVWDLGNIRWFEGRDNIKCNMQGEF